MYRAGDEVDQREWLAELDRVASRLGLGSSAKTTARDIFLGSLPDEERSKQPVLAASIYAAALIEGDPRDRGRRRCGRLQALDPEAMEGTSRSERLPRALLVSRLQNSR